MRSDGPLASRVLRLFTRYFHQPRHKQPKPAKTARRSLSRTDVATLDWLNRLKQAAAPTNYELALAYVTRAKVMASCGPLGMRAAVLVACEVTDAIAAAMYTGQARATRYWYGAR